jgi:DNA-binding NarL/FixJ family response regulator/transposase
MPTLVAAALPVSVEQRDELTTMAGSAVLPHRIVVQAQALLMAADGIANQQIARSCAVDSDTVRRWRARFARSGLDGVGAIANGRGRRSSLPADTVAEVLRLTQHERPPGGAMRWSTRALASRVGIGKDAVARIWAEHDLTPWKVDTFTFSNDPSRTPTDVVGLQRALLRGDVPEIKRLVEGELSEDGRMSPRRARLLAGRSFAHILDSDFAAAHDDARAGLGMEFEQPLFRALCALSSGMGGLERHGSDIESVEGATTAILALSEDDVVRESWSAALTAEAAMSVGRLDLAETVARRVWLASARTDPPEAVFAGQTLARALLFQGRLEEASALALQVEEAAERHGLLALRLVVRGSLAYVDALRGRYDDLTRHAASIDELASHCPGGYFVAGSMVLTAYALATAQRAKEAANVLLRGAGGPQLPNIQLVDRAYGYELLVTAALSLGEIAAARQWGERATALTGLPRNGMAAAAIRRMKARLAVADGEVVTAAVLAEEAAAIALGNAGHLDATRARLLAGSALLDETDDNWSARRTLSSAGDQATLLGATSLALLARRDLRSIGLRLIGERQQPMTPREREVAELLLAGASNAQIAAALGLSPRTVQSHVGGILKALDLPSRAAVPGALRAHPDVDSAARPLTPRQREVANLISRGYTNDGAARSLHVSTKTIEKHLDDIYRRLGINSRAALAARWSA